MLRRLFFFIVLWLTVGLPAHAQTATYTSGSIYDLEPSASQSTGNRILEQVLNSNDMQPVRDLAEGDILRELAKPVGRLAIGLEGGKVSFCTASVIAADLILTNHHCIPGAGNVKEALLWMGYTIPKSRKGVAPYPVEVEPVEADKGLDYAILRVRGRPGEDWGTVRFGAVEPPARRSLFLIHHPGGFAQHLTRGRCQTADPALDGDDLIHVCDTIGGSSGAPIFDNNTRKVIGLHYSAVGLRQLNAGKRIASLAKKSELIAGLVGKTGDTTASATPAKGDSARSVWQDVKTTRSPSILKTFIKRFSGSIYADFARVRLEELGERKVAVGTFPDDGTAHDTPTRRAPVHACDRLAASQTDPQAVAPGVNFDRIDALRAITACREARAAHPGEARFTYQLARALATNGDYGEAVQLYRTAAAGGYAGAMNDLGALYTNGEGVPQDYAEAARWFRRAADKDDVTAIANLGWMYLEGWGVDKDEDEAVRLIRRAVDKKGPTAMFYLGALYGEGRGVQRDDSEAVKWFRRATERGDMDAAASLGWMISEGRGAVKNQGEALRFIRMSAESGNAVGMANLGVMYDEGRGVPEDDLEAVRWYRKAAEKGEAQAAANLAWMYANGEGVAQDDAVAIGWYRKAAEKGNVVSMNWVGRMYDEGQGVTEDNREAIRWYRRAAEAGNPEGMFNLGVMYANGEGIEKDHVTACGWYGKAADAGKPEAITHLGLCYDLGRGVQADDAKAVRLYRKAAEQGHGDAMYYLGWMYDHGEGIHRDTRAAAQWFRKALENGNERALKGLTESSDRWQAETRRELQRVLSQEGAYTGAIDGQFGPATTRAIRSVYEKRS